MDNVQVILNVAGYGGFYIMDGNEKMGEMAVTVEGNEMTVHHTEVSPKAEGKGLGKKLLAAMTDYARQNKLVVIPHCAFVHAQFKRHPDEYADIWKQ